MTFGQMAFMFFRSSIVALGRFLAAFSASDLILLSDATCAGAVNYLNLASEILKRNKLKQK